jgi:hypothetical protein
MAAPFLLKRVARSAVQESDSGEGTSEEHVVQTWRQRPNASGDDRFEERDDRALGSKEGATGLPRVLGPANFVVFKGNDTAGPHPYGALPRLHFRSRLDVASS